jgi:hypothetical protein
VIRNERQFLVTRSERERLANSLDNLANGSQSDWALQATRNAVSSQLMDLDDEIGEYEALRDGRVPSVFQVGDLAHLPEALIRARIASRLTQRELGDRLGLREQQVQRYEAGNYSGASLSRLQEVMTALGVTLRGELELPSASGSAATLRRRLIGLGLDSRTVSRRLFGGVASTSNEATRGWLSAAARASRIFGMSVDELMSGASTTPISAAAFRASSVANKDKLSGYALYAEYISRIVTRACTVEYTPLPGDESIREELAGELTGRPLEALLRMCWQHGIPVVPLADPSAFYGALWTFDDRPAIALKHHHRSPHRWAFLLAHEIRHARKPGTISVLEQELTVAEWRDLPAEQAADTFASWLLLGDGAEAMAEVAVEESGHNVARLKSVVPAVAKAGNVAVGVLADHLAFRLAASGVNWWPTANTLHPQDEDAWRISRTMLFEYIDLTRLDELDRDILIDGIAP